MKKLINSNFNVRSSFDFGRVAPLLIKSTAPNDKIKLDFNVVSEMLTPLFETFDVSDIDVYAFWQANKFIDKKFVNNFIDENKTNYAPSVLKSSFMSDKFKVKYTDRFDVTHTYNVNFPLYLLLYVMSMMSGFDIEEYIVQLYKSGFVSSYKNGYLYYVDGEFSKKLFQLSNYQLLCVYPFYMSGLFSQNFGDDLKLDFSSPINLQEFVKYSWAKTTGHAVYTNDVRAINDMFDISAERIKSIFNSNNLSSYVDTPKKIESFKNHLFDIRKSFNEVIKYLSYFSINVSDFLGTLDYTNKEEFDSFNLKLKAVSELSDLPFLLYDSIMYEWFTDFELRNFFGHLFEFVVDGDKSIFRLKREPYLNLSPTLNFSLLKESSNIKNPYVNSMHLTPRFGNYDIDVTGDANINIWQDYLKNSKKYNYDLELWQRTPKTYDKLIGTVFDFDKKKTDEYVKFIGKKTISQGLTPQVVSSNESVGRIGAFSRVTYSSTKFIDTVFNDYGYLVILVCPVARYSIKSLKPKWQREKSKIYELKNNNKTIDKITYCDIMSVKNNTSLLSGNNVYGYAISNNEFLTPETDLFVGQALYDDSLFAGRCFNTNRFSLWSHKQFDSKAIKDTLFYVENSPMYIANFNFVMSVLREV